MLNSEVQCIDIFPFLEDPQLRFVEVPDSMWSHALKDWSGSNNIDNANCAEKEKITNSGKKPADGISDFASEKVREAGIRDNFNMFLNHLQLFEKMILSKTANESDLKDHLQDWIRIINEVAGKEYRENLLEYMRLKEIERSVVQTSIYNLFGRYCSKDLNKEKFWNSEFKLNLPGASQFGKKHEEEQIEGRDRYYPSFITLGRRKLESNFFSC